MARPRRLGFTSDALSFRITPDGHAKMTARAAAAGTTPNALARQYVMERLKGSVTEPAEANGAAPEPDRKLTVVYDEA